MALTVLVQELLGEHTYIYTIYVYTQCIWHVSILDLVITWKCIKLFTQWQFYLMKAKSFVVASPHVKGERLNRLSPSSLYAFTHVISCSGGTHTFTLLACCCYCSCWKWYTQKHNELKWMDKPTCRMHDMHVRQLARHCFLLLLLLHSTHYLIHWVFRGVCAAVVDNLYTCNLKCVHNMFRTDTLCTDWLYKYKYVQVLVW